MNKHPARHADSCPICNPSLITEPSLLDDFADWIDRDPLVALGWLVIVAAALVFLVGPLVG
jgi:hypothetical protein